MIHGEKDAYIVPKIVEAMFARAGEPKEKWIVPKAKHNRCREAAPEAYRERIADFLHRHAPRREVAPLRHPTPSALDTRRATSAVEGRAEVAAAAAAAAAVVAEVQAPVSG
jgi:hypothetical protein